MTPEEFRRIGHQLIDWIADYRARIDEFPVMSQVEPGSIRACFSATPPEVGESLDANFINDLERIILPGITHWNHPSFFAYFPSNASLSAVLGDLLSTGLGAQGMLWQTSPAATELEEVVLDWLRQLVGLSEDFVGVIHDTASTANLVALLCAREQSTNYSQTQGGLQAEQAPLTVYTSSESHGSVEKAALLAGFGRVNVRAIETDDEHAMDAIALEDAINRDLDRGLRPCAVVATIGTTPTSALDPLDKIAQIALQTVCVRHVPPGMSPEEVDAHTLDWVSRINRSGKAFLTPAKLKGRWMVRVSIGAEPTEHEHVEALWLLMQREAECQ